MNPPNPLNTTRRQALVLGSSALAASALAQPADTLALFFSRHSSAGAPPAGTLAHTFE